MQILNNAAELESFIAKEAESQWMEEELRHDIKPTSYPCAVFTYWGEGANGTFLVAEVVHLRDFFDGAPVKTHFEVHYRLTPQFSTTGEKTKWRRFVSQFDTEQAAKNAILESQRNYPKMYKYALFRIDSAATPVNHQP